MKNDPWTSSTVSIPVTQRSSLRGWTLTVVFFALCSVTIPSWGDAFFHTVQGSACTLSNQISKVDYYERDGKYLRNTGATNWDIFIASCPISQVYKGYWWHSFQVSFTLETTSANPPVTPWCIAFDDEKNLFFEQFATQISGSSWAIFGTPRNGKPVARFAYISLECMVPKGASLNSLSMVWSDKP